MVERVLILSLGGESQMTTSLVGEDCDDEFEIDVFVIVVLLRL